MPTTLTATQDMPDTGTLQVNVNSILGSRAISGATIQIFSNSIPDQIIEEITTDVNGQTEPVVLPAPPLEYSMEPTAQQPYSLFNVRISAPGYEGLEISGAEILSGENALQNVSLMPRENALGTSEELFVIPPHTLYGDYPPKIAENEIKSINETGEIVLSRVVIPSGVRNTGNRPSVPPLLFLGKIPAPTRPSPALILIRGQNVSVPQPF